MLLASIYRKIKASSDVAAKEAVASQGQLSGSQGSAAIAVSGIVTIRPIISPYGRAAGAEDEWPFVDGYPVECEVAIQNVGQSCARILGVVCRVEWGPKAELNRPISPAAEAASPDSPLEVVLEAGASTRFRASSAQPLPDYSAREMGSGTWSCRVIGWISYQNQGNGPKHLRTEFHQRFDIASMRFTEMA